tara:strand:- start:320 stop:580 length:261 start_codon:yes stop_codon:yes gene_type:complete
MNNIEDINNIYFRLIANHEHLKSKNIINKTDYLKLYIEKKFNTDTKTINNLINHIENMIENVNLEKFIINTVVEDIITNIENANIY